MDTSELEQFARRLLGDTATRIDEVKKEQLERFESFLAAAARKELGAELEELRNRIGQLESRVAELENRSDS